MPDHVASPEHPAHPEWPLWLRVSFRFACLYWALYMWPLPGQASLIDAIPWGNEQITNWLAWPLARLTHWVGIHFFHLVGEGADWHPTGSGDTAMNYVQLAVSLVLAIVGTAVWSAIDERRGGRREYRTVYAWLRLLLRFSLAAAMLEYGFAKIFPGQFGLKPGLLALQEAYGDSSPMHVLWFFMGLSRPYTIFGGMAEAVAGVLLLFRKTSTIGLLITAGVMANVVALNFCYDVPVKLYSTHLFLMSVFLLLPDLWPMWTFFVRRRPAELTGVWLPVWERRSLRIAARIFQVVFLCACAWSFIGGAWENRTTPFEPAPVRGVWAVDSLAGWTEKTVPKTLVMDGPRTLAMVYQGGGRDFYSVKYDADKRQISFPKREKPTALQWDASNPSGMKLEGTWMGAPVKITVHRTNPDAYPLMTRGFHWVQERAFNN